MSFWRRPFSQRQDPGVAAAVEQSDVTDGTLHYVVEKAGNDSGPTYQEATGAPVEVDSPLGYSVGAVTVVCLNVSNIIGTGIYSQSSSILEGTGSVGLAMIYWALGFLTSITSFSVYLEFASYFSNRSGSEVVYLEQAFPRPRWFFPTTFAFQSVVLSFSSGNAIGNHNSLRAPNQSLHVYSSFPVSFCDCRTRLHRLAIERCRHCRIYGGLCS